MDKTTIILTDRITTTNGVLLYKECSRETLVYQFKALQDAYLKDKIHFKPDLIRCTKRKNSNVLVEFKPALSAIKDATKMIDKGNYKLIDSSSMSRTEMIIFLKFNPNVKVTHWLFDSDEYIVYDEITIRDENNYLFEDWISEGPGAHNGIRQRYSDNWLTGWYVKN